MFKFPSKITVVSFSTLLVLAACTQKPSDQKPALPPPTPTTAAQSSTAPIADLQIKKIENAVKSGSPIKCEITKSDGTDKITFYLKGDKTKAVGKSLSDKNTLGYMISDATYMYVWSEGEKQGIKINLKDSVHQNTEQNFSQEDFSKPEVQQEYSDRGYKYDCNESEITDSEFVPPKDIKFTDYSQVIKNYNLESSSAGQNTNQIKEEMRKYTQEYSPGQ